MTKRRARQLFNEYIELLGIQHWKIELEFCKKLDDEADLGTCATNEDWQRAKISLLKPSDPEWERGSQDVEETMVHEEQSVKATARAIVALRRLRDGA